MEVSHYRETHSAHYALVILLQLYILCKSRQLANPSKAFLSPCVLPIPDEARFFHGDRFGASQFIGSGHHGYRNRILRNNWSFSVFRDGAPSALACRLDLTICASIGISDDLYVSLINNPRLFEHGLFSFITPCLANIQ